MATSSQLLASALEQTNFASKEIVLAKIIELGCLDQFTDGVPVWRDTDSTEPSEDGQVLWIYLPNDEDKLLFAVDMDSKDLSIC